jgi:hypothetical protein
MHASPGRCGSFFRHTQFPQHRRWDGERSKTVSSLAQAEAQFDAMITCDQHIKYQQNRSVRKLAVVVLPTNDWPSIRRHAIEVLDTISSLKQGGFIELKW